MGYNDNISLLIQRISSGKLIFYYEDSRFYALAADNEIKYEAELLYEKIIEDNKFSNWIKKENLHILLDKVDIWNKEDEDLLKKIEKKLENQKLSLYNERLKKQRVAEIKKEISLSKDSISKLLSRKHSFDYITLEDYASGKKIEFLFTKTICDSKNNLVFDSDTSKIDYNYFTFLTSEIANHFISIEQYKQIARSEHWKTIWNANKSNVFNRSAIDLTDEQKSLINVSVMYDRIYEHPEAPDETVIEDDDMLDGWMIYQKRKTEASKKEGRAQDILAKHGDAREIFIVGDKEDAEDIYSLNSHQSSRIVSQRKRAVLSSDDGVDEFNLPDVQMGLLQKTNIKR